MTLCLDRSGELTARLTDREGYVRGRIGMERFGEIYLYYWTYLVPVGLTSCKLESGHTDTFDQALELILQCSQKNSFAGDKPSASPRSRLPRSLGGRGFGFGT